MNREPTLPPSRGALLTVHDRVLAFVAGATALGIVQFWASWFWRGAYLHEGSDCFRAFENTFPLSDVVLAAILIWVAAGLWRGVPSRAAAGLAVGMLLHLASLDLLWYGLGLFTVGMNPDAAFNISTTFVTGLWLMLRLARSPRGDISPRPLRRAGAGLIVAAYVAFTLAYWWNHYRGGHASPELSPCAQTFTSTFWLADLLGCLFGAWALLAGPFGLRTARFAHHAVAGGMFFGTTNVMVFVLLDPARVGAQFVGYLVIGAAFYAACAALIACARPTSA